MNVPWLRVRRRPRIAILSTGDEVVMPGEPIGPNQIVASNGLSLSAFVTVCGGQPINLGIAADDRDRSTAGSPARAAPTCWSPPAAPRSASTTWCARRWSTAA